jgi:uncharacterized membrane-anchored protein YitT (DUF2179 family)
MMAMSSLAWVSGRRRPPVLVDSLGVIVGCLLMALGFHLFLNANGIVGGGVVGLSTIAQKQLAWDPGIFQWTVNIPLLAVAVWMLGRGEALQSVLGTLVLPLFITLLRPLHLLTHEPILAAIFGGATYGAGLGLILRHRGSVGGFSLIARIAVKNGAPVSVPGIILVLDSLTIIASVGVFGTEKALYGLLAAFILRKVVDSVILGFNPAIVAWIVSTNPEPLKHRILEEMDRGLTVLPGEGGFSGQRRPVLMTVISRLELPILRALVQSTDPEAFLTVSPTNEVVGRGFIRH